MSKVYLLIGGNMGDKRQVFDQTIGLLSDRVGEITRLSGIYETEPWGFQSDQLFWNQVLELSVNISAEEVLEKIQHIEHQLGRLRKEGQYNSRIIDIDILFYDDLILELPQLTVPHPRIRERKFALIPLDEIAAEMIHPVFQKTIHQLLIECKDHLKVERID